MRVAILDEQQRVVNIIVADEAFAKAHSLNYVIVPDGVWCDIGATWDGKAFQAAA